MALYPTFFGYVDLPEPIPLRPDRRRVVQPLELRLVRGLEPWTRADARTGRR